MLVYLSLDIISPSKLTVSPKLCSRKSILISEQNSIRGHCLCQLEAFLSVFPWLLAERIQSHDVLRPIKCEQIYLVRLLLPQQNYGFFLQVSTLFRISLVV